MEEKRELNLRYSPEAVRTLEEIWAWNAQESGIQRADAYLAFLRSEIKLLPHIHGLAPAVPGRPTLRYMNVRRKARRHGHIVVFRVREHVIEVINLYHTAQDWQRKISD